MACKLGRDLVPDLDIIEVAKSGLQVIERRDEGLVSLTVLVIKQKVREELGSVSQLLSLNPNSVTLLRSESVQMTTLLLKLAPTFLESAS